MRPAGIRLAAFTATRFSSRELERGTSPVMLWHVGATIALTRYAFRDDRMDLRVLAFGAILPDLIDSPVGLIWFESLGSVRLVTHTLLASAAMMIGVVLSTRRGRPRKRWMPLAIGMLMHLLLDAMWNDPETLWWPFLGWEFSQTGFATAGAYVESIVSDWRVWALEAVGLVYLIVLGRRAGLSRRTAWQRLRTTGTLDAPIERTSEA